MKMQMIQDDSKRPTEPDRTGLIKLMVIALREQGFSCRKIGKRIGISGGRVHQILIEPPKNLNN